MSRFAVGPRVVWFMLLPLFILNAVLWMLGRALESIGDVMQQGADALKDQLLRWGRVLFSVVPDRGAKR